MSNLKIKITASVNMVGGKWSEVFDMVEDLGIDEDDACEYIANGFMGSDDIDEIIAERARELSGYDWGVREVV
jgi:hypothetical protein